MIRVVQGDITTIRCDAIVNAANSSLLGGGGVDGAIHRAGGPSILEECRELRRGVTDAPHDALFPPGSAVVTGAGTLPAKMVVHAVGPVWRGGGNHEALFLAKAYRRSLEVAAEAGARSIAFPNISTGVYGFPRPMAARIAVETVRGEVAKTAIQNVTFVCFDDENLALYRELLGDGPVAVGGAR